MARPVRHGPSNSSRGDRQSGERSERRGGERGDGRRRFFRDERDEARPSRKPSFNRRESSPRKSFERKPFNDGFKKFDKFDKELKTTYQPGLFQQGRNFLTKSAIPGKTFFDMEQEKRIKGEIYRDVDPKRSKFVAAIAKGLQQTGLKEGSVVLYLGASHGYTPSFMSDIIGGEGATQGMLFCLDFAPRVVRDLYFVCEARPNMAPILASASKVEDYKDLVPQVDVVFQDIAQKDQVGIFLKNCDAFLKKGGFGMIAIKARSIDVTAKPKDIFKRIRVELEENKEYTIIEYRELDPFEEDHAYFTIKKK